MPAAPRSSARAPIKASTIATHHHKHRNTLKMSETAQISAITSENFDGRAPIKDRENDRKQPIRLRKLTEIDLELTVSKICLIVIFLTVVNSLILTYELITGNCIAKNLNLTDEFMLVRIK